MRGRLVFDFDGVLANSARLVRRIANQAPIEHGERVRVNRRTLETTTWMTFGALFDALAIDVLNRPAIAETIKKRLASRASDFRLFPGMGGLLGDVLAVHSACIVTSNHPAVVAAALPEAVARTCPTILPSEDVLNGASARRVRERQMQDALASLGGTPLETILIGDTVGDIELARWAGTRVIAVTWGYHPREKLRRHRPDALVDSHAALRKALRGDAPPARHGWVRSGCA